MTQKKQQPEVQPTEPEEIPTQAPDTTGAADEGSPSVPEESTVVIQRAYGYWILTLFVVFTGSLISVSWFGWQLFQTNSDRVSALFATQRQDQLKLSQSLKETQDQLAQLRTQQASQEARIRGKIEATQQTNEKLDGRLTALEKKLAGIQDRLGQGERAWKAAEIGFLLTRAQERLSIAQDPAGAAVALKLADQRLAALALPQAIPVRAAISDALAELNKADDFDAVGMALRLGRAAEHVSQWPLIGTQPVSATTAPTTTTTTEGAASKPAAETAAWYVRWPQDVWRSISSWFGRQFTLTRSDEPVKASARASDDRETRLWLTAVREGLLSQDVHLMLPAIVQAQHWIKTHYASDAAEVGQTLAVLKETQDFYTGRQWPNFAPIFTAWREADMDNPDPVETSAPTEVQP